MDSLSELTNYYFLQSFSITGHGLKETKVMDNSVFLSLVHQYEKIRSDTVVSKPY